MTNFNCPLSSFFFELVSIWNGRNVLPRSSLFVCGIIVFVWRDTDVNAWSSTVATTGDSVYKWSRIRGSEQQTSAYSSRIYPSILSSTRVIQRRRRTFDHERHSSRSPFDEPHNSQHGALSLPKASTTKETDASLAASILNDRMFLQRNHHWIVFVDDEEAIRQSVGDFLYDSGYQITACSDATAVVEVCRAAALAPISTGMLPKTPSCIVSDIRMPGGPDGLELLQWIRSSDTLKRVPVILLTAKGLTEDRIAGYKAGADVYLPKPFYPQELLSSIDNVIQRRQQMKGTGGALVDLQQEMANLKLILKQNSERTVQQTSVYLTPASREVLDLLCRGYTNAEIAEERGTSKHYVTKTLKKIYHETGTSTRTELLKWAIRTGYVSPRL